jgi:hypothetical protein
MCVILGYADNIQLCEKHHLQYCDIDLPEDPTTKQVVKHEKAMLRFQAKCGSLTAQRSLVKMERDLDNYILQFASKGKTVAEHRVAVELRDAEAGEPYDPEEHGESYCRVCELYECECEQDDDEDDDEFGDLGDYL